MTYVPKVPVSKEHMFREIEDRMDVVYHGPGSKISHLRFFGHGNSMCGQWPRNWSWLGTENQDVRDKARSLPLCDACIGSAFRQGYLTREQA